MIAGPLPFRGPPPDRDAWVLGQSIPFNPEKWRGQLPSPALWPPELGALPVPNGARWPRVDRRTVFQVAERAAEPLGAAQTFVAASVWGSGTGGYARARLLRVLEQGADAVGDLLAPAVRILRAEGPLEAYTYLHRDGMNVIKHLGPSFGTKVLYFSGYDRFPGDRQPLILDRYVAIALRQLCGLNWPALAWTTAQYGEYLDLAHAWARAWQTSPDVIERVLFSVGKASPLVVGVFTGLPLPG